MSCSRRSRLAQTPDRRVPKGASPSTATRIATFLLLLVAGLVALAFAARLTAVAFHRGFSPFHHFGAMAAPATRAWLLAAAMFALVVLLWLVLRSAEETVWLAGEGGGVLVPAAGLERIAEQAAALDPDVVRCEARVRQRAGAPVASLVTYARPYTDRARLMVAVERAVRGRLALVTGVEPGAVTVRTRVLDTRSLARHLP